MDNYYQDKKPKKYRNSIMKNLKATGQNDDYRNPVTKIVRGPNQKRKKAPVSTSSFQINKKNS